MAKREVVSLNESVPQLQVPQSGDTYQLCRDVYLTTGVLKSEVADGASAVGVVLDTENSFANGGAKLVSIRNAGTEKAYVDKNGQIFACVGGGRAAIKLGNDGIDAQILKNGSGVGWLVLDANGGSLKFTCAEMRLAGTHNMYINGSTGNIRLENYTSDFVIESLHRRGDEAVYDFQLKAQPAYSAASTHIVGGNLELFAGDGASGSAGNAHGGNIYLTPGTGYGTGHHGYIIAANLPTSASGLPAGAIWNNSGVLNVA